MFDISAASRLEECRNMQRHLDVYCDVAFIIYFPRLQVQQVWLVSSNIHHLTVSARIHGEFIFQCTNYACAQEVDFRQKYNSKDLVPSPCQSLHVYITKM